MNNIIKLISASRSIVAIRNFKKSDAGFTSRYSKLYSISTRLRVSFFGRDMSQRSITSFFTKTPKKSTECVEKNYDDKEKTPPLNKSNDVKEKRSSKRQRIESSGSESQSPVKPAAQPSPETPEKKRPKRQRIESSGGESSPSASPAKSPEAKLTVNQEAQNSILKTYSSPKTKKTKTKPEKVPLVEKNVKVKQERAEEEEKPASKRKSSPDKSPEQKKEDSKRKVSGSKSPASKKEKATVKTEKDDAVTNGKGGAGTNNHDEKVNGALVAEEEYNPAKAKYHPVKDACWAKGQPVPYLALAKTLETIEATSARLRIVETLSNFLRSVMVLTPEDLLPSVYMCLNQLAPAHHSVELGIAETYLMKAIGQSTGRTLAQTRAAMQRCGDLGLVAEQARATQRTMFAQRPLTARKVFESLKEIAHITGQASVNKKIAKIQTLYVACRHSEARYLIRSLAGKLRIGLAEQSVLQALALACALTPPGHPDVLDASKGVPEDEFKARVDENALTIKSTYCACPNYELLLAALLRHGVRALPLHCRMAPGVPLKPMLAQPSRGVRDLFTRFEGVRFTCEWKYDGERAQLHVPADAGGAAPLLPAAAVFSRNQEPGRNDCLVGLAVNTLTTGMCGKVARVTQYVALKCQNLTINVQENNTSKYPDILRRLPGLLRPEVSSCVLDAEAVAYDVANKQILPFQILSTRKRKDAQESEIKVQVCVFLFDLLYLNGESLVARPLRERRRLLREYFNEVDGEWQFATWKDCNTVDEVQQFLEDAVKGSCEGLMVKTLEGERSTYEIARRSHNWLKLKKDYLEGVGDTLDVVVIGGYRGRGKRAGGFGGFLLACREPDSDQLQSICKIGTGFSDEALQTLSAALQEHIIDAPKPYYRYDPAHSPDAWFAAACVWEVRCADLSLSPAHRAAIGLVAPDKGISLRFPRFVRVREDKTPDEATSAQQVAALYLAQDQVKNQATSAAAAAQDDFY